MPTHIDIVEVDVEPGTRHVDMADLGKKLSADVAAIYFENPSYLGHFEPRAADIIDAAHAAGALAIAGELGIPVKLIGVGEGIEDDRNRRIEITLLRRFDS